MYREKKSRMAGEIDIDASAWWKPLCRVNAMRKRQVDKTAMRVLGKDGRGTLEVVGFSSLNQEGSKGEMGWEYLRWQSPRDS